MKSKPQIPGAQLVLALIIARILFASNYIPAINPGASIQDIIPSVFIIFIINLLIAVPILLLLRRHPGRDLIDCSIQVLGGALGSFVGLLYFLFIIGIISVLLGVFSCFYTVTIIKETAEFAILIPVLVIGIYGAVKGIESITRFGVLVFIFFLIMEAIIFFADIPLIKVDYLKPLFFNGYGYFLKSVVSGVVMSFQIVILAMCTPYLKPDSHLVRTYVSWDIYSMLFVLLLDFFVVTVMGAYGSKQIFPLQALAMLVKIDVFERLDSLVMISWVLNVLLVTALYLFAASQCLKKTVLGKRRIWTILAAAVLVFLLVPFVSSNYIAHISLVFSPAVVLTMALFIVILPLFLLLADIIKDKVDKDDQAC